MFLRFHAMGWTFPWSVVAVRGLNVCLRKIDYPLIWRLLKEEGITHFNAAPTVNTLLVAAKEAERLPHPVQVTVAASPPSGHLFQQMVGRKKIEKEKKKRKKERKRLIKKRTAPIV